MSDRLPSSISTASQSTLGPSKKRGTFGAPARAGQTTKLPPPTPWASKDFAKAIVIEQGLLLSSSPPALSPESDGATGSLYFDALTEARATPINAYSVVGDSELCFEREDQAGAVRVIAQSSSLPSACGSQPCRVDANTSSEEARSPSPSFSLDSAFARQGTSPRDSALASLCTADGRSLYSRRASIGQSAWSVKRESSRSEERRAGLEGKEAGSWRAHSPLSALLSLEQT